MTFDFTASTKKELMKYAAAPAHPVPTEGKCWTEMVGWKNPLDKDGFLKGTPEAEKKEIREMIAKGMACLEAQKKAGRVFNKPAKTAKKEKQPKVEKPVKKAAAKPVKKGTKGARVSKYGSHKDGTVQFVPARKIYHGWFEGKIAVVSSKAEVVKAQLLGMGVEATTDVVFNG